MSEIRIKVPVPENLEGLKPDQKERLEKIYSRIKSNVKIFQEWNDLLQKEQDNDMSIASKTESVVMALKNRLEHLIAKYERVAKLLKAPYKSVSISKFQNTILGNYQSLQPIKFKEVQGGVIVEEDDIVNAVKESVEELGEVWVEDTRAVIDYLLQNRCIISYIGDNDVVTTTRDGVRKIPMVINKYAKEWVETKNEDKAIKEIEPFVKMEELENPQD